MVGHCRHRILVAWAHRPKSRCRRGTPGWTVGMTCQPFRGVAVGIENRTNSPSERPRSLPFVIPNVKMVFNG